MLIVPRSLRRGPNLTFVSVTVFRFIEEPLATLTPAIINKALIISSYDILVYVREGLPIVEIYS
jgi:hypothetical protein